MPRPAPNLSPIERRLLDAIVSGMPAEVLLDWVAFRRLLAFGYVDESESGRVQATIVGKRALADIKKGDGPEEE